MDTFKKSDYFFELPPELIAQTPVEPRDSSRLMCLDRKTGEVFHHHFHDLTQLLRKGDLLLVNDARVLPARLYGVKEDTGAKMEFLLLEQKEQNRWEVMVKPGRRAKVGSRFVFGDGLLKATVLEVVEGGNRLVEFECEENIFTVLDRIGQMPLPPYITEKLQDKERYQTVYSHEVGSAAAPTAGLHFTKELMQKLEEMGVKIAKVTLHVGLGTFRPVKEENILEHKMLVSAFAGSENVMNAYRSAVEEKYRFFSFGDAMLITDFNDEEKRA